MYYHVRLDAQSGSICWSRDASPQRHRESRSCLLEVHEGASSAVQRRPDYSPMDLHRYAFWVLTESGVLNLLAYTEQSYTSWLSNLHRIVKKRDMEASRPSSAVSTSSIGSPLGRGSGHSLASDNLPTGLTVSIGQGKGKKEQPPEFSRRRLHNNNINGWIDNTTSIPGASSLLLGQEKAVDNPPMAITSGPLDGMHTGEALQNHSFSWRQQSELSVATHTPAMTSTPVPTVAKTLKTPRSHSTVPTVSQNRYVHPLPIGLLNFSDEVI